MKNLTFYKILLLILLLTSCSNETEIISVENNKIEYVQQVGKNESLWTATWLTTTSESSWNWLDNNF